MNAMRISPSWQRSAKARSGATIWRCADPAQTPEAQDWRVFRRDHSAESSLRSLIRHLRVESLPHAPSSKRAAGQGSQAVNFREVVHSVRTGNADVAKLQRFAEDRMDTHKNARLTPKGREEMVRAVADRSMSKASVSRILKRRGLSRLSSLELQEPHPRYEREKPGEIIHLDIKKLGRFSSVGHRVTGRRTGYCSSQGAGWEFVHVAIDDHSRIARAEIFPDQKKESAVAFLVATVAYFRSLGITVERVMTDNGSCYLSKAFARACKQLAVKHIRIKPYTPQTNGKAERFIQTALREWAYATAFEHSEQRYAALPAWLYRYNWHRPHVSLARKPPISRLGLTRDNLLRLHN